jgi:hypothetical protein
MDGKKARPRRIPSLGLVLFLIALPACHGGGPWYRNQPDSSSNVAYRPVYTTIRGRPFYVSGYGGADYSPSRPRRNVPNCPVPIDDAPVPVGSRPDVTVSQGAWDTE